MTKKEQLQTTLTVLLIVSLMALVGYIENASINECLEAQETNTLADCVSAAGIR